MANLIWTKPITLTIYANCSAETFAPTTSPLTVYLQKNDPAGLVKTLAASVADLFSPTRANPLCIIKDWDLIDLSSTTPLGSSTEPYIRSGQATRTNPMAAFTIEQTHSVLGELVMDFRLRLYTRDVKTGPWFVHHPVFQTMNIKLGCYKLSSISLAEPATLHAQRTAWDGTILKLVVGYSTTSTTVSFNLYDLLVASTNDAYCKPY